MMADRMDIWRLEEFELERLPSAQDVYLFRAVANDNERDERLVALAEVRDLTPVRDDEGRITALPALERMVRQAFEAMRSFQAAPPAAQAPALEPAAALRLARRWTSRPTRRARSSAASRA